VSPLPPARLSFQSPTGEGTTLLARDVTRIGRMLDNDLVLCDLRVSRHHAIIRREPRRFVLEDLGSLNGTFVDERRITGPHVLSDGQRIRMGNTLLTFEQEPGPLVGLLPEKTIIVPPLPAAQGAPKRYDTTLGSLATGGFRPKARRGWALKRQVDEQGREYFILKSLLQPAYLRLTERDVFLWKLMDGRHSLRDMLLAYMARYRALGADRLHDLLDELARMGFLEGTGRMRTPSPKSLISWLRGVAQALLQKEFAIGGFDAYLARLYRAGGWFLFTKTAQMLLAALVLAGALAFGWQFLRGAHSLLQIQGSYLLGTVALCADIFLGIFLHDMAHALTCKSYGREVRRAGLMLYYGMPVFFVDTSDIWMEPKGPRISVSWAGPYTTLIIGSLASLALLMGPSALVSSLLFELAATFYLNAFLNLSPFLELDGYFMLMDWLEMPLLRKRSLEFVRGKLWNKLRARERFSREERIFAVFGLLSALWSALALGMSAQFWWMHLSRLLGGLVSP
jgi:putative peptide zinc metalloprotease protein